MPDDPRIPSLDELTVLFAAVEHPRAKRNETSASIWVTFEISSASLEEAGVSFTAFPSAIFTTLVEHLQRLQSIDATTEHYRNPDKMGATAADCAAFIQNELKNIPPTYGLQERMQRQMFARTIEKLTELSVWRAAVDAERFQKQREAERKRQAEEKAAKERWNREEAARAKEHEKSQKKAYEQPFYGSDWSYSNSTNSTGRAEYEDLAEAFRSSFTGANSFEDLFKEAFKKRQEHHRKSQTYSPNSSKRPWYTVLGVSATASKEEIKVAYRKLASKYHPDRCKDADAGERMAEINAARDLGLL